VPNIAESVSKGLAGAVYGVILILLIYLMPSGVAGLVRLVAGRFMRDAAAPASAPPEAKPVTLTGDKRRLSAQ
jgi:branched-chain amino acid transport system permease protein